MKYAMTCFSLLFILSLLATTSQSRAEVVGISSSLENPIIVVPSEDRSYLGADPQLLRTRAWAFLNGLCAEKGEGYRVLGFRFGETSRTAPFIARMPGRQGALPTMGSLSPNTLQWNYAILSRKKSRNFLHKNRWQIPQFDSPFIYGFPRDPVNHRDAFSEVVGTLVTGGLYWVIAGIETAESKWKDKVIPFVEAQKLMGRPVRQTGLYIRHSSTPIQPLELDVLACGSGNEVAQYPEYQYFGNIEEEFTKLLPNAPTAVWQKKHVHEVEEEVELLSAPQN